MLQLTPAAWDQLRLVLRERGRPGVLRVYVEGGPGGGVGVTFDDAAEPEDNVLESDGVRIVVDPVSAYFLDGIRLDHLAVGARRGFILMREDDRRRGGPGCACGRLLRLRRALGRASRRPPPD